MIASAHCWGDAVDASAHLINGDERQIADAALSAKYGEQKKQFDAQLTNPAIGCSSSSRLLRMPSIIQRVLHPDWYHGHHKRPPFFEGWYFKLIDASEQHRYAVIPGIFLSDDPEKYHAFVQVLDGLTGAAAYFRFPPEAFMAAENDFDVKIGPNRFRRDGISLNLEGDTLALKGDLRFENTVPYPVTWTRPGIMGPFGWLTFMECYHGVVSLDHRIDGALSLGDQSLDFSGGRGRVTSKRIRRVVSGGVDLDANQSF